MNAHPAASGEYGPTQLVADADRILTACWRTAAVTIKTNVPRQVTPLGEGGADRSRVATVAGLVPTGLTTDEIVAGYPQPNPAEAQARLRDAACR